MSSAPDRLDLARLFLRVAETGSLSAAGRALGIPQPTVSRRLRALEEALGARLVNRTTHSLSLTEAGEAFRADARRLLDAWDEASERFGATAAAPRGRLRVVAPVALGQTAFVPLALRFLREHPAVEIDWELTDAPVDLAARGADCLLRVGAVEDEGLVVRRLGVVRRVVAAAPTLLDGRGEVLPAPAAPGDLAGLPFAVARLYGGGTLRLSRGAERAEVAVRPALACDSLVVIRRAVLEGSAAAVLPTWFIAEDLAAGRLLVLCPGWEAAALPVHLAWSGGRFRPARLAAFLAFMGREAPAVLAPG